MAPVGTYLPAGFLHVAAKLPENGWNKKVDIMYRRNRLTCHFRLPGPPPFVVLVPSVGGCFSVIKPVSLDIG